MQTPAALPELNRSRKSYKIHCSKTDTAFSRDLVAPGLGHWFHRLFLKKWVDSRNVMDACFEKPCSDVMLLECGKVLRLPVNHKTRLRSFCITVDVP